MVKTYQERGMTFGTFVEPQTGIQFVKHQYDGSDQDTIWSSVDNLTGINSFIIDQQLK